MTPNFYYFLHVASGFLLVALTFKVFANPKPAERKTNAMLGGTLALVMLVSGFGLVSNLATGFPVWIIVKIACWLVLASLVGLAHRNPSGTRTLAWISRIAVLLAVYMVYFRPF